MDGKKWDDELTKASMQGKAKEKESVDPDEVTPPDMKGDYLAYSHFRGRLMPCVQVYFNAEERKATGMKKKQMQYVHLVPDDAESGLAADGKSFALVFGEQRLTVVGRNLEKMYDLISYHKLAWIRSIDDNQDNGLPKDAEVITAIRIETLEDD